MPANFAEEIPEDEEIIGDDTGNFIPEHVLNHAINCVSVSEKDRNCWYRPSLPRASLTNKSDLSIQWLDMDVVTGQALSENPNRKRQHVVGQRKGAVPVLRTYGVSEEGHSVAVFIHGFTPYGYFAVPEGFSVDVNSLNDIRKTLEVRLKSAVSGPASTSAQVVGIELVNDHTSIYGYVSAHSLFLKVYVSLPGFIPKLKTIMEAGIDLPGVTGPGDAGIAPSFNAYECNVPFVLRYMVDRALAGAGWITLPKETYAVRTGPNPETHCQV